MKAVDEVSAGCWFSEVKEDLTRKSQRDRLQSPRKNWEKVMKDKEEKKRLRKKR